MPTIGKPKPQINWNWKIGRSEDLASSSVKSRILNWTNWSRTIVQSQQIPEYINTTKNLILAISLFLNIDLHNNFFQRTKLFKRKSKIKRNQFVICITKRNWNFTPWVVVYKFIFVFYFIHADFLFETSVSSVLHN